MQAASRVDDGTVNGLAVADSSLPNIVPGACPV
jgi:hypothetical protein